MWLNNFLSTRFGKPKKLYKYMDAKGAKNFFDNPSLWFSLPSRLNDIYDLNPVGAHPTQWGGAGILCFSDTPTSVPMWAHYGKKGNGVVLEFSFQSDFFRKYPPRKVRYRSKRPVVKNTEKAFLTKDIAWSYEREWRCITAAEYDEFHEQEFLGHHQAISVPFPYEALTSVIYGHDSQVVEAAQSFLTRPEASHVREFVCRENAWNYGLGICTRDYLSYILERRDAIDLGRR